MKIGILYPFLIVASVIVIQFLTAIISFSIHPFVGSFVGTALMGLLIVYIIGYYTQKG